MLLLLLLLLLPPPPLLPPPLLLPPLPDAEWSGKAISTVQMAKGLAKRR